MKRFMKGCAITALIFGIIGVVFATVGGAVAGASGVSRTVEAATKGKVRLDGSWGMYLYGNKVMDWILPWINFDHDGVVDNGMEVPDVPDVPELDGDYGDSTWYDGDDDGHIIKFSHSSKVYEGDVEKYCPGENIKKLEIEIGGCRFETETSQDGNLYLEASNIHKFQGYVEGDTLYIKSASKNPTHLGDGRITLYIPEDYRFQEVDVELGAGELDFPFLYADSASLDVGAGQLVVYDNVKISDLDISVGAGSVTLDAMEADKLDVEVGMGVFSANEVEIGKSMDVECSMGSVELTLKGREGDFNYDLECAMGNIELDGKDYGGFGQEATLNNGASREISLECSMGYIGINFTD